MAPGGTAPYSTGPTRARPLPRHVSGAHSRGPRQPGARDALSPSLGKVPDGAARCAPFYRIRPALGEPRSALGAHAYKHRHRMIRGGSPVVLGVPFGPGPAHVIKFGPVRVEKASGQVLHELGDIGQDARLLAVAGVASSYLFHDPSGGHSAGSPFAPFVSRTARRYS